MTLQHLLYFVEVYRKKSITKAAENLFVTQQTISVALQKLEAEFNTSLFTRSANRITPTKAADDLYQYSVELLNQVAILKQNMQKHSKTAASEKNALKIGMSEAIMNVFGDAIADRFALMFPDIHFHYELLDFTVAGTIAYEEFDCFFPPFQYNSTSIQNNSNYRTYSSSSAFIKNNSEYAVYNLLTLQSYVWISTTSPLCKQSVLTPDLLKNLTSIVLNDAFNSNVISLLNNALPPENVKLKSVFSKRIETENCIAFDAPFNNGKLFYEDILAEKNVVAKPFNNSFSVEIIYKKSAENLIPILANIIS